MDQGLIEKVRQISGPFLTEQAVELVDLLIARERGRSILRFLVDRPGGITLDECARLNQQLGCLLDEQNIVQGSYVLEVSSPGLNRPLVSTRDFQRAQGQLVKIVLHQLINRQNVWVGLLEQVDEDKVTIQTEDKKSINIVRKDIARAKLEVRL